jgi:cell division protein FtsB
LRRAGLTGRAAVLALVLCALVVMLADPLQTYLRQQSQIAQQRADNNALQRRVGALEAQQRLWSDPAYVRQQARARLYFVMPGETPYVVVGRTPVARRGGGHLATTAGKHATVGTAKGVAGAKGREVDPVPVGTGTAWYGRLWSTVRTAGATPVESSRPAAPRPATRVKRSARPAPIAPTHGSG